LLILCMAEQNQLLILCMAEHSQKRSTCFWNHFSVCRERKIEKQS